MPKKKRNKKTNRKRRDYLAGYLSELELAIDGIAYELNGLECNLEDMKEVCNKMNLLIAERRARRERREREDSNK